LPPPPPEELPPNELDPNKIIPRTLPPFALAELFKDNRRSADFDVSRGSPKHKGGTSKLIKSGDASNEENDNDGAKGLGSSNAKPVLVDPHPENRDYLFRKSQFSLDHFIHPSVFQYVFNGKRHEFRYEPSKRFDSTNTKWGAFNPDFVNAWLIQPDILENSREIKKFKKN
jgi:hypothetical protein